MQSTGIVKAGNAGSNLQGSEPDEQLLAQAGSLPCRLVLEAPVRNFTVQSLLELSIGSVVETAAQHNDDLTLQVNGELLGTVKFDVTGDRLAIRVTGVA